MSWRGPHHPKRGGAEVYTEELLSGLAEKGHRVSWYSGNPSGTVPVIDQWRGIDLFYGRAKNLGIYWEGHHWLKKRAFHYDLIIDQLNTFGFLAPPLQRPGWPRIVALIHQLANDVWDYEVPPPFNLVGRVIEKRILGYYRATPFITVSPSTLHDMRRLGWRGPDAVVPNGIALGTPRTKATVPVIAFLGRVNAKAKRLNHALAVYQQVKAMIPDTEFWIIGRGQLSPSLQNRDTRIRHYRDISDPERDSLLAKAWVCLATSVREGWGRMVSESAAVGTASVVYDVPGLRDAVLHQETGLVVPPDPGQAAKAVLSLFHDPVKLESLSQAAYRHAKQFSWPKSVNLFESALFRFCQHQVPKKLVTSGSGHSNRRASQHGTPTDVL